MNASTSKFNSNDYKVQFIDFIKIYYYGTMETPLKFVIETNSNSVRYTFYHDNSSLQSKIILDSEGIYFVFNEASLNFNTNIEMTFDTLTYRYSNHQDLIKKKFDFYISKLDYWAKKVINRTLTEYHPLFPTESLKYIDREYFKIQNIHDLSNYVLGTKSKQGIEIVNQCLNYYPKKPTEYLNLDKLTSKNGFIINSNLIKSLRHLTTECKISFNLILKQYEHDPKLTSFIYVDYWIIQRFLDFFSPAITFKLLLNFVKDKNINYNIFNDIFTLYNALKNHNVTWEFPKRITYKELFWHHNNMSKALNNLKLKRNLPASEKLTKLENIKILDCQIILPRSEVDLVEWGKELSICVGSYGQKIIDQDCYILGLINSNNTIKYCVELEPTTLKIIQFNGEKNISAPIEYWSDILYAPSLRDRR